MKKSCLLLILLPFAFQIGYSQAPQRVDEKAVAKPAKNSFQAKYPGAKVEYWEMEGNDFEAMFTLKGDKMEAVFTNDGAWVETESWLTEAQLPPAVLLALGKSHLESWKIKRIEKVSTPADEEFYEIDLVNGDAETQIYYDHDGVLLADDRWVDEDTDDILVDDDDNMDGND